MHVAKRHPFLAILGVFLILLVAVGLWVRAQLPAIFSLADYRPIQASKVYAQTGEHIGTLAVERRTAVAFEALPKHTVQAFLAAEDADFYAHEGIDWFGVARALLKNLRPGAHLQGASTITQQTVKTLILGPERSLWRKMKEAILARRLEQLLPKDAILALYLNQIYFGHGAYGIEEAALSYFGKSVEALDLFESTLLACIPKNPSRYTLKGDRAATKRRQSYVLQQMVLHGWATRQDADTAQRRVLPDMPEPSIYEAKSAAYVEHVRRLLAPLYGLETLNTAGLRIYTHLVAPTQMAAVDAVQAGLEDIARRQGYSGAPGHVQKELVAKAKTTLHGAFHALLQQQETTACQKAADVMWDLTGLGAKPQIFGATTARTMQCRALLPFARTRAMVVALPAQGAPAVIDLGSTLGALPLANMAWARPFSPKARTPRPLRPADVLQVGDLIDVEIVGKPQNGEGAVEVALVPNPEVEAALVAMAPPYGAVVAMVGGRDATAASGFNRATQAMRQPGSAFKPILYAAGLTSRAITPASPCADSPVVITDANTGAVWKPENYEDGHYDGTILYRTALAKSKNTCSVRLLQKIGVDAAIDTARAMGIDAPMPQNLTLSLGTGEATPLMMAEAMHTLANRGRFVTPQFVEQVLDSKGNPWPLPPAPEPRTAVSEDVAFVLTSMMRSVVENGTARRAQLLGRPTAAKTGTSQLSRDAWIVGFVPTLAAVVWVGMDDDSSMGSETGASAALPAWVRFMGAALADEPLTDFVMPTSVRPCRIDPCTGARVNAPAGVVEVFVDGTEPEASQEALPSIFLEDD